MSALSCYFFFQAEDGIRDLTVTGVQTCALPISGVGSSGPMPSATPAPAQPPTPESTARYCLPSGPRYVIGLPMIPEGVLNFHSSVPVVASTALIQPSIVP